MASTRLYSEALEKFQQAVLDRHKDSDTRRLLNDFLLDGKSNFSTPDAARNAAGSLATDAGQKYGGIKIGKVEVVPKKWVDNVLGNIDNIVAVGGYMMKNAPESVGVAWFAISLTLKAISNNYSLYALFGKGLTDITEVMIIIVHYDRLYDERQKSGFRASNLVDKLFRDTVAAYSAVLDFAFSVKKHMSGGALDKLRHGFKDFFNAQAPKFQGKLASIADLKGKILESSQGAFQDKTMQQFGDVRAAIEQVQQNQSQALELQLEQRQMLTSVLEDFKDFKDSVKRKTPWDYLKDEFMANKKKLAPLPEPHQSINKLLANKHEDTCKWILDDEKYQNWEKSDKSTVLCILGGPGSGKSTLLASLVQQLETKTDTERPFINFVSCLADDGSQAAGLEGQKLSRVCNTLLSQIYELAAQDDGRISLLETCNQILRNPKSHKAGQISGRGSQGDGLPDFVEAMGKLVTALQRSTILIIDAVGTLSREDQNELYDSLQELINDTQGPKTISVLIASRSDSTFVQRSVGSTESIDVSIGNKVDMETVINSRLKDLSGWSDAEKQQAKESVLNKAGSRFGYIDDVAVPFLEQPFQRPVANYLRRLPEGMNESFEQAIRSMPQNYFELLRLAVTWCLLSPRAVTVKEVIEAYSGVYTVDENGTVVSTDMDTNDYDPIASALEVQQIVAASGPFLSTERTDDGQTLVKLQDARQVKNFCEHSAEEHHPQDKGNLQICDNCKSAMTTSSSLAVDAKVAHFEIALTLLRHLNNPLFQRRFDLLDDPPTSDAGGNSIKSEGNETSESPKEQDVKADGIPITTNGETNGETKLDESPEKFDVDEATGDHTANGINAEGGKPEAQEGPAENGEQQEDEDDDRYTEPSIDEDFDHFDTIKDVSENVNDGNAEFSLFDITPELRCEINNWPYHLLEAEKLWPHDERKTSEVWSRLNRDVQEELNKFVSNQEVFHNWQRIWGNNRAYSLMQGRVTPLYLAAVLGLSVWAEHLLEGGADINETSLDRSVLQASAEFVHLHQNVDLLRLLLSKGGDIYYTASDDYFPAFTIWLLHGPNLPVVQVFTDYQINFEFRDRDGWTGMHTFVWMGTDPAAFDLIMHPKDSSKRPDINAEDNIGETPLHRLLWRRDLPLPLLKALLAVEGINVNHDDRESQQPLGVASTWGSLNVVKLLLEANANVEDEDSNGQCAMIKAAQGDHVKCIQALLDAHAKLEPKDKGGSTPLQHAAYQGRKAAVELLVAKGSDINSTNAHNRTPFFNATRCLHGGQETAQFLLTGLKKASYTANDINKVTKGGRTPLRQAAAHGFADVLKELLEYIEESNDDVVKATINKGDEKLKRTPLHCAARRGDPECVRLLIKHGADGTLKDSEGNTPLAIAQEQWAQRNESSFEDVLLHLIDSDQQAAIADAELPSIAAASGSVRVLQKLHSIRADLNRTDSFGWSPLAHAKQLGHKEAERFLKHETSWGGALPCRWVDKDSLTNLSDDGLHVTYEDGQIVCIVSDKPLPPSIEQFYFEITLERLEGSNVAAIGFCTLGAAAHEFPGWTPKDIAPFATSWGYHGDDGTLHHRTPTLAHVDTGESYASGDTVGCGVDLETHKIWFTKNGKKLDHEFDGVRGRLFPILGLNDRVTIKTNFGMDPFVWKDEQVFTGDDSQ